MKRRKAILAFVPIDLLNYHKDRKNRKAARSWDDYMTNVLQETKNHDEGKI